MQGVLSAPSLRAILAAAVLSGAACAPRDDRPSAVLITLDTTRADALGVLGGKPGVTPFLDRLARESVLYEAAQTVAPLTLPAHASMMTGLYPPRHGVRDNNLGALPESAATLAEIARDGGCATAAFVSAAVLDRGWGLAQGFEVYDGPDAASEGDASGEGERSAAETVRAARRWLERRDRGRPFFLWIHLFDPHAPYAPDARSLVQAAGDRYLGEVAAADRGVGEVLDALRRDEAFGRTTIIVVADHGEALGEHGEPTHSVLCYRATLSVPFLVRHPDGRRAGERSPEIVSVVDVAPTIAEALRLPVPAGVDGLSLDRGPVPEDRGVYFESYAGFLNHGWSPIAGWIDRSAKLVASPDPELYLPREDPAEASNRAAERAADVARMRAEIAALARRPALAATAAPAVDEALRARVRSMGYAGAADPAARMPDPLVDSGRPPPRERMAELVEYYAAVERAQSGDVAGSIRALQEFAGEHPADLAALDMLGALLAREGRPAEAIPVLERLLAAGSGRVTTHTNLGACYEAQGDLEAALRHFRSAAELAPGGAAPIRSVARVLEALGRRDEAASWRARAPSGT